MTVLPPIRAVRALVLALAVAMPAGCGTEQDARVDRETPSAGRDASALAGAPFARGGETFGPADEGDPPLALAGNGSVEDLRAGLAAARSPEAAALLESGYRQAFTVDRAKRDYAAALAVLEEALALDPGLPQAHRALGQVHRHLGEDMERARAACSRAIELEPDYGEAYYDLAALLALVDRGRGAAMYRKAMELGVPDEADLGERFYAGR